MLNRIRNWFRKPNNGFVENAKMNGSLDMIVRDFQGRLKEHRHIKNTITGAGKAMMAALLCADSGGTGIDYIAIGTGTPSATALGGECTTVGGQRRGGADVAGTIVTTGTAGDTAQFVTTFTFTGSFALTEEGLFNAAAAGTMPASQTFAAVNVVSGDTLTCTHKIQITT